MGNRMIWVKFPNIEAFNAWHTEIKEELNLPKASVDIEGNVVLDAIVTNSYVDPILVSINDIRALIDDMYMREEDSIRFDMELSESPFISNYDS